MRKILIITVLLLTVSFADEVVTFDNNWADNPLFNVNYETGLIHIKPSKNYQNRYIPMSSRVKKRSI